MRILKSKKERRCQKITLVLGFTKKSKEKREASLQLLLCSDDIVFPSPFSMIENTLLARKGRIIFDGRKKTLAQKSLGGLNYYLCNVGLL